jgi:uncharacterized membrane protein YkoI
MYSILCLNFWNFLYYRPVTYYEKTLNSLEERRAFMRKVSSLLVAMIMLIGIMAPMKSYAQSKPKIELKQAIEIAKDAFDISTEGYNFSSNYLEDSNGKKVWELNWKSLNTTGGNIYVSVDGDTGDILNMNRWGNSNQPVSKIPKYSKEEALKAAKDFIKKLVKDKINEVKLQESPQYKIISYAPYTDSYSFNFVRQVNGLDFLDNGISIAIDKNTLAVKSYNYNWDNGNIPDSSKAISLEEAKKIFIEKLGLELSYNLVYSQDSQKPKAVLVYTFKNGNMPIDAVTGEVIKLDYIGPMFDKAKGEKKGQSKVLTPEEQKSIENVEKYITKEQAIDIVKKHVKINEKYRLNSSSLYAYQEEGGAIWFLSWNYSDNNNKDFGYISAEVDAVTKELKSFSIYGSDYMPPKNGKPKYDKEAARKIADDFLSEIQPDKFKHTEYRDYNIFVEKNPLGYSFSYIRKESGAVCPFSSINVYVNAYTGQVMQYNLVWPEIKLPSTEGVIDIDEAYNNLFSKLNFSMKYIEYSDGNETPQMKLVYKLDNFAGMLDAKTGDLLDYNGEPIKGQKNVEYTDIKGHSAEKDINLLAQMGIIDDESDKYMPDEEILQKDFIKMIVKSLQPEDFIIYAKESNKDSYDKYYNAAIQRKIITEKDKNPDAPVTRQEAAKMVVKALGVGFVADLNIYNVPFEDADSIENAFKVYVAIASELNIINAIDGRFNPQDKITRGDAATIIVNYMKTTLN